MGQLENLDFTRALNADTSREYTPEELLQCRKQYFESRQTLEDEHVNENYELICNKCKGVRFYQKNNFVVTCRCTCQAEAIERERKLEEKRQKMLQLEKLKQMSLLGARYQNSRFENLDMDRPDDFVKAVARCKTYCEKWEEVKKQGLGIYFYGDVGTGKSELTACIGHRLLEQMVPVLFTNFFEIAKEIKKTYNPSSSETESGFIHRLTKVDLLIIDDIGTETFVKNGERTWIQEKIYDVINARYINQKPTIFSSNDSLVELVEERGLMKKIVDRIASMSTAKIQLRGESYRLKQQNINTVF